MVEFKKLLSLIKANEQAIGFNLKCWLHFCDMFGCLVGNDVLVHRDERPLLSKGLLSRAIRNYGKFRWTFESIGSEYGITTKEAKFLFFGLDSHLYWDPQQQRNVTMQTPRNFTDRKAAINRVRKFVYYKLHKRGLMEDPAVRHLEGDHHVVRNAVIHNAVVRPNRVGDNAIARMDQELALQV